MQKELKMKKEISEIHSIRPALKTMVSSDSYVPKKKVATSSQKKTFEQAHKKKQEIRRAPKTDNKENETPAIQHKAVLSKRVQKEVEKSTAHK